MIEYTWHIADMDREVSDGYVFTAHWTVEARADGHFASTYGSIGLERPDDDLIPYDQLTEEVVVGWVKAALGDELASIEASLAGQIEHKRKPAQASGTPWA